LPQHPKSPPSSTLGEPQTPPKHPSTPLATTRTLPLPLKWEGDMAPREPGSPPPGAAPHQAPPPGLGHAPSQPQAPPPGTGPASSQPQAPPPGTGPASSQPQAPPPNHGPASSQPQAPPSRLGPASSQPQAPPPGTCKRDTSVSRLWGLLGGLVGVHWEHHGVTGSTGGGNWGITGSTGGYWDGCWQH
uniref:Uncharacterized protein n=1 Tax=Calidris pygmaea TaxID=425635 RepID=A0A8C3PJ22_9CHAR